MVASSATTARNIAPIALAPAPSSSRRSGISTMIIPKPADGRAISQMPLRSTRSVSAMRTACRPGVRTIAGPGSRISATIRPAGRTTKADSTAPRPNSSAAAPSAGPSREPAMAAPIAVPMAPARSSRGADATTQARPPAHTAAPPKPWTARAAVMTRAESAKPKTRLAAASVTRPTMTVTFAPTRAARRPAGIASTSVPTGKAAVRRRAGLGQVESSTSSGSSGVIVE